MTASLPSPPLLSPTPPTRQDIHSFLTRHLQLLALERHSEVATTSLLSSKADWSLLEKKGLSIGGLGISSTSVGLGGKTLLELWLPSAYHSSPLLPTHTFRTGDPAKLIPHASGSKSKAKGKGKSVTGEASSTGSGDAEEEVVEGVVARVTNERITLAVKEMKDVEIPERVRL